MLCEIFFKIIQSIGVGSKRGEDRENTISRY